MRARRCASASAYACAWVALLLTVLPPGAPSAARATGTASTAGTASRASTAATVTGAGAGRGRGAGAGVGGASEWAVARNWPVGTRPAVLRGWDPPATPYGPGHRGVDLAAADGAPVRAVAAGRVSFAGRVAGRGVVSVELAGTGEPPLRTTYEPVRAAVHKGDRVAAGQVLGTAEAAGSHCTACLHWGLLRGDTYLDPLTLLPPWLLNSGPSRLLPVLGVPLPR
ncbi:MULTISPECIES: M23 family metallopeptidase [Streptomyces]|uniref:murein hydrolase activator EnvC family protein n=1 Tax=Streptomyces TaxID=1883 RepID=UPI001CC8F48A|nr:MULTISPECIES: M23 family metallopeptidase [Streptomyces]WFB85597.1 M23 family metallopeptidase [Streptomyces olivaceus]WGK48777.1 M23 family metallopeptidase [Streptomyces sp. B146]